MILTYHVIFGGPFRFDLEAKWGPRVELGAIEFMNGAPIDWRLGNDPLRPGLHAGHPTMRGFHDLQRAGLSGGTRGIPAGDLELETRGIGDATVLVWLRPGTYPENGKCGV